VLTNLFQLGDFILRSGKKAKWKIDCDALTKEDWEGLAAMAVDILPPFAFAWGVPRGGLPFADALNKYGTNRYDHPLLIAEDVCTTGGSMSRCLSELAKSRNETLVCGSNVIGVCVFAREPSWPSWVKPLFCFNPYLTIQMERNKAVTDHENWKDPKFGPC
jgi:orotate phosphoribosyltransferase